MKSSELLSKVIPKNFSGEEEVTGERLASKTPTPKMPMTSNKLDSPRTITMDKYAILALVGSLRNACHAAFSNIAAPLSEHYPTK